MSLNPFVPPFPEILSLVSQVFILNKKNEKNG